MKRFQRNVTYLLNIFFLPLALVTSVACYPTHKNDLESQSEFKDEQHFPNGTTIGKYTYTDSEGNPIQVKYYADDASYGVELKSIKVMDATSEPFPVTTIVQNAPNRFDDVIDAKSRASIRASNLRVQADNKHKSNKFTNYAPYKTPSKNKIILRRANPDYEDFSENELKGKEDVQVCSNDKLYREMRSVAYDLAEKSCDRF